jgi:hypothetical protein
MCAADSLPQALLSLLLLPPLLPPLLPLSDDTVVQSVIMSGEASPSAVQSVLTALPPMCFGAIVHSSVIRCSAGCRSWSL